MAVKGLQKLINDFKNLEQDVQKEVKQLIGLYTNLIETEAIKNAPGVNNQVATQNGTQTLSVNIPQFIFSKIINEGYTGIVGLESNASLLAIYIEFGTGASAAGYVPTLPKEFQDIAQNFFINGRGTLIKKPFLLPAYFKYQDEILNEFKDFLDKKGIEYSKK